MGKRSREDKEKAEEARRRVKTRVEDAFNHFGKNELYEEQLFRYFMKKGMSRKEVEKLIVDAIGMNLIVMGARSIFRKEKPEKLGHITVFWMKGKEDL